MAGQGAKLAAGMLGKASDKLENAQEKLTKFLDAGSYWIWEAREKYCAQDVIGQIAQEMIPFMKAQCTIWSNLATGSYIVAAGFIIGSALLFVGACLSRDKSKISQGSNRLRCICLMAGPSHAVIGVAAYFVLTKDFPGGSGTKMTFGSAGAAILSFLPYLVSECMEKDKPPGFKNREDDTEQAILMKDQKASYQAAVMLTPPQGQHFEQQFQAANQPYQFSMPSQPPQVSDPQGQPNFLASQMVGGYTSPGMPMSAPERLMPREPLMNLPTPKMPLSWGFVPMAPIGGGMSNPSSGMLAGGQMQIGVGSPGMGSAGQMVDSGVRQYGMSQPEFR
eukprot:CAMPEP_0169255320 /NCGR_PEP_ID=MMETSP1016-20121227/39658_1 /TAXON_ID=342587 /ORGANISM="Karlodinium micrum, Strain CCMP2283" /LENGTH=334 /DNA_ID=CAMNT_0009336865 /DNA_START=5 /DNA_END=1010 /DNA_ORIENTATION=-